MELPNLTGLLTLGAFSVDGLVSMIYFLLAFSLVIFVHELGHFAVAKFCGVKVLRFSIGMPPRLIGIQIGETDYCIGALPLGGYVKMLGQDDSGDSESETGPASAAAATDPRAFNNKSVSARAAILSAGVVMNLIFAFVLFIVIFRSGNFTGMSAEVGRLVPEGSAAKLRDSGKPAPEPGDVIASVNGTAVSDFTEIKVELALSDPNPKVPLDLTVKRGDKIVPLTIQRDALGIAKSGPPQIGFSPAFSLTVPDGNAAAGLNPGETVVGARSAGETGFTPVTKFLDLELAFARNAGQPLTLRVQAAGEGEKPGAVREVAVTPKVLTPNLIGQRGSFLLGSLLPQLKIDGFDDEPNNPGKNAGLRVGDIVRKVNGTIFPRHSDLAEAWAKVAETGESLSIMVLRGDAVLTFDIAPNRKMLDRHPSIGLQVRNSAYDSFVVGEVPALVELSEDSLRTLRTAKVPDTLVDKLSPLKDEVFADRAKLESKLTSVLSESELKEYKSQILAAAETGRAAKAGLHAGDVITEFNGRPVRDWNDLARAIIDAAPEKISRDSNGKVTGKAVPLTVGAAGTAPARKLTVEVLPREYELAYMPVDIGVAWEAKQVAVKADTNSEAVRMGLHKTWYMMKQVYVTLKQMVTGKLGAENLSGPIGIVAVGAKVAQQNPLMMWYLLAAISVNLAVLNFLPIPVLDGGHIVFLIAEKIRGSPVPAHVADNVNKVGLLLLLSLFLFVTFNDVSKFFK